MIISRVTIENKEEMIKVTLIARTSDAFLLCESRDSMVGNYENIRSNIKKILVNEKIRSGEIEFVEFDNSSYIQYSPITKPPLCQRHHVRHRL